jgi:hypothetical protein
MGNQGTSLDTSREAIAQLKSGVLGTLKEVYAWSNRPIWAQGPGRRMTMEKFAAQARKEAGEEADKIIEAKKNEIARALEQVDWKSWIGVAPDREFWPGLYHAFAFRGWWDFGTGALGDMACHQLTVPFASCGLRDPISVVAKTSGHDFDSGGTIVRGTDHPWRSLQNGESTGSHGAVCSSSVRRAPFIARMIIAPFTN